MPCLRQIRDRNCDTVKIALEGNRVAIWYNTGISLQEICDGISKAEAIMTTMHPCSNEKKLVEVGDEFCELGIMTLNAASQYCNLETVSNRKHAAFRLEKGQTADVQFSESQSQEYTFFDVLPDPKLFGNLCFDALSMRTKATQLETKLNGLSISISQ